VLEVDRHGARSRWETLDAASPAARVTGGVAVADGRVIVAMERADGSGFLRALGAWDSELGAAARGGVVTDPERVYALDTGAELHAVDACTGAPIWSSRLGEPSERWALGYPVVVDDTVYAGSAMSVGAFDARDGSLRWHTALASADWAATWSGVAADHDVVIVGAASDDLHLAALDAATGVVRWQRAGRDIAGVTATPVIAGDAVLAVHAPGWLRAYSRADGSPLWKAPLDDAWPVALAIDADRAFVRSSTGHVLAFTVDNGAPLWTAALDPALRAGRPYLRRRAGDRGSLLVVEDAVWTPSAHDLVALDTHTGAVVHRIETDREVAAAAVADGVVHAVCSHATAVAG
jgi:outer membrane protein assembly factor BamB